MSVSFEAAIKSKTGYPVAKLYEIGDCVSGALVYFDNKSLQARDYSTDTPINWPDGSPKMLTELYILVDRAENCFTSQDRDTPVVAGDIVRIIADGSTWFEWKTSFEAYRDAGHPFSTDMHILWVFDRQEPSSNPKYGNKNIRTFTLSPLGGGQQLHAAAVTKSVEVKDAIQERLEAFAAAAAQPEAVSPAQAIATAFNEDPF